MVFLFKHVRQFSLKTMMSCSQRLRETGNKFLPFWQTYQFSKYISNLSFVFYFVGDFLHISELISKSILCHVFVIVYQFLFKDPKCFERLLLKSLRFHILNIISAHFIAALLFSSLINECRLRGVV